MSRRIDQVQAHLDAYNERDWETISALAADDVLFYDNALGTGGLNKESYLAYWKGWESRMSDEFGFDPEYFEDEGKRVVIALVSFMGTHDGEDYLPGLKANGNKSGVRLAWVWRFNEMEQFSSVEIYWDILTPLVELGHTSIATAKDVLHTHIPPKVGVHYSS